jgi:hypothetical protein
MYRRRPVERAYVARDVNCLFQLFRTFVAVDMISNKVRVFINTGEGCKMYMKGMALTEVYVSVYFVFEG